MKKNLAKRLLVLSGIIGAAALFHFYHLDRYFTLSYIKESQRSFAELYSGHPAMVIAGYMALYILVTSLSLPGAAVLTIGGGALFGLLAGTVVVSFASSIGATLACSVARFLLRDWVQEKFGDKIAKVNEGVEREGAFYLFTLRLIPVFPFWVINLVMGITKMPLRTFYWVSQVGMLPGTIVYVNAGKELAKVESMRGILSPGLILSFLLLGLFPIAVKKIIALYRSRKAKDG